MRGIQLILILHTLKSAQPILTHAKLLSPGIPMPAFGLPVAVATVGIILSILVYLIRVFVRAKIHGPFGWDDYHSATATILGVINSAITISQAHYGLGQHVTEIPAEMLHRQFLLA